jgi:hypothetical protein
MLDAFVRDDYDLRLAVLKDLFAIAVFATVVRGHKYVNLSEALSKGRVFQQL